MLAGSPVQSDKYQQPPERGRVRAGRGLSEEHVQRKIQGRKNQHKVMLEETEAHGTLRIILTTSSNSL